MLGTSGLKGGTSTVEIPFEAEIRKIARTMIRYVNGENTVTYFEMHL